MSAINDLNNTLDRAYQGIRPLIRLTFDYLASQSSLIFDIIDSTFKNDQKALTFYRAMNDQLFPDNPKEEIDQMLQGVASANYIEAKKSLKDTLARYGVQELTKTVKRFSMAGIAPMLLIVLAEMKEFGQVGVALQFMSKSPREDAVMTYIKSNLLKIEGGVGQQYSYLAAVILYELLDRPGTLCKHYDGTFTLMNNKHLSCNKCVERAIVFLFSKE